MDKTKEQLSLEIIKYCNYFIDLLNKVKYIVDDSTMDLESLSIDDNKSFNIYKIKDKLYNEYCILLSLISQWILKCDK